MGEYSGAGGCDTAHGWKIAARGERGEEGEESGGDNGSRRGGRAEGTKGRARLLSWEGLMSVCGDKVWASQ